MVNYYIRKNINEQEVLQGTENGRIIDLSSYTTEEEKQQKEDLMNLRGDY